MISGWIPESPAQLGYGAEHDGDGKAGFLAHGRLVGSER